MQIRRAKVCKPAHSIAFINKNAQQVNLESNDWFNYAGFFWVNLSDRQLQKMQQLLKAQGCKTVEKNGEEWFSLNSGILIKTH